MKENVKQHRNHKRPRVEKDWSHDEICLLIESVEERPSLWNKTNPEYKQPTSTKWQEIAELFDDYTPDECKAKWTNLRVTFSTNLAKYESAGGNKEIKWKYFDSMLFLEPSMLDSSTKFTSSATDTSNSTAAANERQASGETSRRNPPAPVLIARRELAPQALPVVRSQNARDEFTIFGEFVASELRGMPMECALNAKRKLSRLLVDCMDEVQFWN